MTTTSGSPTPPPSVTGSAEDHDPPTKKPRNRRPAKKAIPHASTLRGLWGHPKRSDDAATAASEETMTDDGAESDAGLVKPGEPLVLRVAPSKLAAALSLAVPRPLTPPNSLPDVVPETPELAKVHDVKVGANVTPRSRSGGKKRELPNSPDDGLRRSPRNHSNTTQVGGDEPVRKLHPLFMGKAARQALQTSAVPVTEPPAEENEPPRKRQKSGTPPSEQPSLLPAKPIQSQVSKSLHPFFMSRSSSMARTTSMESNASHLSIPLLPLPQGKTVYLGNAPPAPLPPVGMNHIYERDTPPISPRPSIPFKPKKGKSTHHSFDASPSDYSNLTSYKPTTDFIPPSKLIIPKAQIIEQAKSLLKPNSHHALLRAFQILLNEDKTCDPDGQIWTHKFRPRHATEVLTSNSAPTELHNWIAGDRKHVTPPQEMDDFVVDDDSDGDYTSPKKAKKQRSRETFSGYSNVVIVWGPHGVGKSACVEACAEELGYQVFEISPGGKRGGKELLEMIGEVGQSELVTKHRGVVAAAALEQLDGGVNVEDASTLKSEGRKALICLEEVDVLYEEDKGFWGCVTGLVEKSRRPVVITCNENFANCTQIEFRPADTQLVRDYLHIITLSQGHIIDPNLLGRLYMESKRDLRQTLAKVQFWCQFSIGDSRQGAEWINWGGSPTDWVVSHGTYLDGVEWRQETAVGEETVLEILEQENEFDVDDLMMPLHFKDLPGVSPQSLMKRQKSVLRAIDHLARFLDTFSFLDCTVDRQFTAYEITPFVNPSPDDVLSDPVLRSHPGRRHERPQGVERRWSPGIQYMSRTILKNALGREGYSVLPLTTEKMTSQPLKDYLYPRPYMRPDNVSDALEGLLYSSVSEDKYQPTLGTLHAPQTIALDVAPPIRNILRAESQRQRQPRQVLLENLWTNVRKTRGKMKEEQEGKTRYFDARVIDHDVVLKTWMDIPQAPEMMDEQSLAVE